MVLSWCVCFFFMSVYTISNRKIEPSTFLKKSSFIQYLEKGGFLNYSSVWRWIEKNSVRYFNRDRESDPAAPYYTVFSSRTIPFCLFFLDIKVFGCCSKNINRSVSKYTYTIDSKKSRHFRNTFWLLAKLLELNASKIATNLSPIK